MENKGLGIIVIVLIWGGLFYLFLQTSLLSEFSGNKSLLSEFRENKFLGSVLLSLKSAFNEQKGIIGVFDGAKPQNGIIHFYKKIDIFDIKVFPKNPELIFAGSNHGLFISRDGGLNWYSFSDTEHKIDSSTKIYKLLFNYSKNNSGEGFISAFQNNKGIVYKSQDKFFSLEKILEFNNEAVYDFALYGDNLYLGLSSGQLLLYSLKNNNVRLLTTLNSAITNLEVGQNTNGLIYLTLKSGGFWVSSDGGQSFERLKFLDDFRRANKINDFLVAQAGICPHTKRELAPLAQDNFYSRCDVGIYAATDYGLIRSLNAGNTWQVFKTLPAEKPKISALALKDNPSEIFAASNGKIYKSRDCGLNWQILGLEFNDRKISVISLDRNRIILGSKKTSNEL